MLTEVNKQAIIDAIEKSPLSMRGAARESGLSYNTFVYQAKKFGLYVPNQGGKGLRKKNNNPSKLSLEDVLIENCGTARSVVKKKIIQSGMLDHNSCSECGMSNVWNGKELVMHLDHVNGVNNDNRPHNLRFLCPNCHSQTETYCGKKK